jgi:hypothetical protein
MQSTLMLYSIVTPLVSYRFYNPLPAIIIRIDFDLIFVFSLTSVDTF